MNNKAELRKIKGFSFLEIIIAVGLLALVVSAISLIFERSLFVFRVSTDKTSAAQEAQTAAEWLVRDIQSARALHHIASDSFGLVAPDYSYIRYEFMPAQEEIKRLNCAGTSYLLAECVSDFSLQYYDIQNAAVGEDSADKIKTVEIDISTQRGDQEFQLNTVARHDFQDSPWYKIYGIGSFGGADVDEGSTIRKTSDGGFILGGRTQSGSDIDIAIFKIDREGNIEWGKNYDFPGAQDFAGKVIIRECLTEEEAYIVATAVTNADGDSGSNLLDHDIVLMKLGVSGTLLWAIGYGEVLSDEVSDFEITNDGGYIIAGNSDSFGADRALLIKTNKAGEVSWAKVYYSSSAGAQTRAQAIEIASEGGYAVLGDCVQCFGYSVASSNILFFKTDENGNTMSATHYATDSFSEKMVNLLFVPGGYLFGGHTEGTYPSNGAGTMGKGFLMKTDANGFLDGTADTFAKIYYDSSGSDNVYFYGIEIAEFGGVIAKGEGFGENFMLARIDSNFELDQTLGAWAKTYTVGAGAVEGNVQEILNEGYIGIGSTANLLNSVQDIVVIETNSQGDLTCCSIDTNPVVSDKTSNFSFTDVTGDMPAPLSVSSDFYEEAVTEDVGFNPPLQNITITGIDVYNTVFAQLVCPPP